MDAHQPTDSQPGAPGTEGTQADALETRLGKCTPKSLEIRWVLAFYRSGFSLEAPVLFWQIIQFPYRKAVKRNGAGCVFAHIY